MEEKYDFIILGTGLTECILAQILSLKGYTVLHIDKNSSYGSETRTLRISELEEKIQGISFLSGKCGSSKCDSMCDSSKCDNSKCGNNLYSTNSNNSNTNTNNSNTNTNNHHPHHTNNHHTNNHHHPHHTNNNHPNTSLLSLDKHFSIDLTPKLLLSDGYMKKLLSKFDINNTVSFTHIPHSYIYINQCIYEVPTNERKSFESSVISLWQKPRVIQFFWNVRKYSEMRNGSRGVGVGVGGSGVGGGNSSSRVGGGSNNSSSNNSSSNNSTNNTNITNISNRVVNSSPCINTSNTNSNNTNSSNDNDFISNISNISISSNKDISNTKDTKDNISNISISNNTNNPNPTNTNNNNNTKNTNNTNNNPLNTKPFLFHGSTMKEQFEYFKLNTSSSDFIGHAIALNLDDNYLYKHPIETYDKIYTYVKSCTCYSSNSPYIYPLYGLSELSQAFCRKAAIQGTVYRLNTEIVGNMFGGGGEGDRGEGGEGGDSNGGEGNIDSNGGDSNRGEGNKDSSNKDIGNSKDKDIGNKDISYKDKDKDNNPNPIISNSKNPNDTNPNPNPNKCINTNPNPNPNKCINTNPNPNPSINNNPGISNNPNPSINNTNTNQSPTFHLTLRDTLNNTYTNIRVNNIISEPYYLPLLTYVKYKIIRCVCIIKGEVKIKNKNIESSQVIFLRGELCKVNDIFLVVLGNRECVAPKGYNVCIISMVWDEGGG
ncbi:GDP dissociation inhibitor protein, partial [Hamiltosporidium tvaerminnensis]